MVLRKDELEAKLKADSLLISSGVLRNEHPLDLSQQFDDFLQACRRGDLAHCQELITAGYGKKKYDRDLVVYLDQSQATKASNILDHQWCLVSI